MKLTEFSGENFSEDIAKRKAKGPPYGLLGGIEPRKFEIKKVEGKP